MSTTSHAPLATSPLTVYTFLATLVLLLAVSSAIVIRSLVLRRRHQRLVEEAIRAGTWVPHQAYDPRSGRRRRDIGEKPKMWEAWLRNGGDDEGTEEKGRWNDIMPVQAAYVDSSLPETHASMSNQAVGRSDSPARTSRFLRPFQRRAPPSPSPPVISSPMASSSANASMPSRSPSPTVRLAVLIAMPSPPQQHSREDDGPPIVEIGIADVTVRDNSGEHATEQ
ncbi:hypothetical protein BV22DRAFT_1037650 [Leucogyrophana mollusca]|uniref:Uncharacterized protein n=1 Tax=Leucogyrophana mollusca TaxID=85980 RepID=A0ACB8BBT4_9AGAM|nr:hypothetical protein BV22DRAFT_1037650 [Leucogyrophana mollusca]